MLVINVYLYDFSGNLFSNKSQIGMEITSLEGREHKKSPHGEGYL